MKKSKAAGIPTDGMYFNVAMSLFFAFINYQAYQDTGAEKPHIVKKSNNMVTVIRANMLCAIVFGLGGIGLNVIQGLRLAGADQIVGVDLNDGKVEMGKRFGMTDFVNPSKVEGDLVAHLVELTGGGADYYI